MSQITVSNLSKTFQTKTKTDKGFIKKLFNPEIKDIKAVNNISFKVEKGETLAFIGPNGAGKSTTIKILTGILFPTSGKANVSGYCPWKERKKLAFKIGSVFGQRSQLSFHLPAKKSFDLFARIYEIEQNEYKKRLKKLTGLFEVRKFLHQPLRKLSLGQRMRCEIIASLLHNPEIIFLDEPTIGLDVVAKRKLREVLRQLNKDWQTTIFLTSHDTDDIEKLCKRTIIINHGEVIYDDKTANLKRKYIQEKRLSARFEKKLEKFDMKDVEVLKQGKYGVLIDINTKKRSIKSVLEEIIKKYSIVDINIEDPSLDEIIENIYEETSD